MVGRRFLTKIYSRPNKTTVGEAIEVRTHDFNFCMIRDKCIWGGLMVDAACCKQTLPKFDFRIMCHFKVFSPVALSGAEKPIVAWRAAKL